MPFGRSARYVRAYTYGCRPPHVGRDAALAVMRARTHLWNALVELDHQLWREIDELRARYLPPPPSEPPPKRRRGVALTPAEKDLLRQWREYRALQKRVLHEHPELQDELRALAATAYPRGRDLKNERGASLWWHNRDTVLTEWLRARQGGTNRPRRPLRFHRETRGTVTVTWSHGRPVATLWTAEKPTASQGLTIAPVPAEVFDPTTPRRIRDKRRWTTARFLVDAETEVVVPVAIDRPIPPNAVLRMAHLSREEIGPNERWMLSIVAEVPEPAPANRSGTIAIDIGWRLMVDEPPAGRERERIMARPHDEPVAPLRVATWMDHEGNRGEVRLSADWMNRMDRVQHLRSDRDTLFDQARAALVAWLAAQPTLPDWLRAETLDRAIDRWRNIGRLRALVKQWAAQRFPGDEVIFSVLEAWSSKEDHLYHWESHARDKLMHQRREQYRLFAAWVARNYGTVVLEHFDLRELAEAETVIPRARMEEGQRVAGRRWKEWVREDLAAHPERYDTRGLPPDETVRLFLGDPAQRRNRVRAACSLLRQAIVNAVEREGGTVTIVPANGTTKWCPTCRALRDWEPDPATLVQSCPVCGKSSDQDVRAALNLVAAEIG